MQIAVFCLRVIAAVLAVWRITELFTADRITAGLRARFPTYLWQCHRCMSVWAAIWAAGVFWAGTRWPAVNLLNYAAALAWLYLVRLDAVRESRLYRDGRRFTVFLDPKSQFPNLKFEIRSDLTPAELQSIMTRPEIFNQIFNAGPVPVQMATPRLSDEEIDAAVREATRSAAVSS